MHYLHFLLDSSLLPDFWENWMQLLLTGSAHFPQSHQVNTSTVVSGGNQWMQPHQGCLCSSIHCSFLLRNWITTLPPLRELLLCSVYSSPSVRWSNYCTVVTLAVNTHTLISTNRSNVWYWAVTELPRDTPFTVLGSQQKPYIKASLG